MCQHRFIHTGYSQICEDCGVENAILRIDTWNKFSAPLVRNYDRINRFRTKVDKICAIHSGPNCKDPVWGYLNKFKLYSPACIRYRLHRSKLNNKHYDCLRIFCDVFTSVRVNITDIHLLKKILIDRFHVIHHQWILSGEESFFSYDYLLRIMLEEMRCPLLIYLKPKTNRRRMRKYQTKLRAIQSRSENKRMNQSSVKTRFHYA